MAKISWITAPGSVANLLLGSTASVPLQAVNEENRGAEINYDLIYGSLPPGITLSSAGVLEGVPGYVDNNNYFTIKTYSFTVRASDKTGILPVVADRSFSIIISNTINKEFFWVTPEGSLGTIFEGSFYSKQLEASSSDTYIHYSFVSGELPPGIQLLPTGEIKGVPVLLTALTYALEQTFRFTIRATNPFGHINDRSFSVNVTSLASPTIEPTTTLLGTYFDGTYFSQQLSVVSLNPAVQVTWSVKEGALPPGVVLSDAGLLSGYIQPIELVGQFGPPGFAGAAYTGPVTSAGSFVSGVEYLITELGSTDFASLDADHYSGKVYKPKVGFIATGAGTGTGKAIRASEEIIIQQGEFSSAPNDFNQVNQSLNYDFTIQAYDGANYDTQYYVIQVASRTNWTADSSITIDNSYLTVDSDNVYLPVILNASTTLPVGRQNSYYAHKFEGFDFSNDTIVYSITNTAGTFDADPFDALDRDNANNGLPGSFDVVSTSTGNLPGLFLDAQSGWLYGKIRPQTSAIENFIFGITVSKEVNGVVYNSKSVTFTLPILGDVNNVVQWITPSDLGTINNGYISDISIEATSILGKQLYYSIYDQVGLPARLPQGLSLISAVQNGKSLGLLSGRVSFEAFTIDNYETTFDKSNLTIDRISTFTVRVSDSLDPATETVSAYQQFTLKLNIVDIQPHFDLYLKAMPAFDQRMIYNSIIANEEIFNPNLIYRPEDPWFGKHRDMQMLFLPGLNPETLDIYHQAITHNHWTKKYNFGDIKSAVVLDSNYKIKYEVVYIEVVDPGELSAVDSTLGRKGPPATLDLTAVINNPYINKNGTQYKILHPNSTENMIAQLEANILYSNQSSLPPWMTSNQPGDTASTFKSPLGFTKAVVLAYTIPGASKLIAYRLKNSGINFNNIEFSVDRYEVDTYYGTYFDSTTKTYISGRETTFDAQPKDNIGAILARVNYAVNVPFVQINGRTIDYINSNGGIDGRTVSALSDGLSMVFAKQENFLNAGPYDGWVSYTDAYIGDDITTAVVEGYGPGTYDTYSLIPGYLEKVQGTAAVNRRGGVWKINIIGEIVYLTPLLEIEVNSRIQVTDGKTYAGAVMYYAVPEIAGQTVPAYEVFQLGKNAIKTPTTFNAGTTKFFTNRDQYYLPNSQDKYLKFPQNGVFN